MIESNTWSTPPDGWYLPLKWRQMSSCLRSRGQCLRWGWPPTLAGTRPPAESAAASRPPGKGRGTVRQSHRRRHNEPKNETKVHCYHVALRTAILLRTKISISTGQSWGHSFKRSHKPHLRTNFKKSWPTIIKDMDTILLLIIGGQMVRPLQPWKSGFFLKCSKLLDNGQRDFFIGAENYFFFKMLPI